MLQGLEVSRARALCATIAESLYTNLEEFYMTFHYPTSHIWNCDKNGMQTRRSGEATVLTKMSSKFVNSIEPDQRKHLLVLSCINANGGLILKFFTFSKISTS